MDKKLLVGLVFIAGLSFVFYNVLYNNGNLFPISSFSIKEDVETGYVTKVIDGDTVVVNGESVRLLGIDAREKGEECYKEARERLKELVLDKEIILEKDVNDRDQYNRLLRHLIVDGRIVNILMVEEGFAIARFYEDKKYREEILAAEKKARENKIGCRWK